MKMSGVAPIHPLYGKRKRRKAQNSNPLFSKWLTEWRDEAREKGWKSEYIYSKALRSLQNYPLPLASGKDCKILQHFGDKICRMLDDRLQQYIISEEKACPESGNTASGDQFHNFKNLAVISDGSKSSPCTGEDASSFKAAAAESNSFGFTSVKAIVSETVDSDEEVSIIQQNPSAPLEILDSSDDDLISIPSLPGSHLGIIKDKKTKHLPINETSKMDGEKAGSLSAKSTVRKKHSVSESEEEVATVAPPQTGAREVSRRPREYVPAYRSGPYAVLLALFRHGRDPDFKGFMTKVELCHTAQPLSDKSFTVPDPGSHYTAWSSVSTLIRKSFLTKESCPAKYRLTDQGYELAHRLEEAERRITSGQHSESKKSGKIETPATNRSGDRNHLVGRTDPYDQMPADNTCLLTCSGDVDHDDDVLTLPSLSQRLKVEKSVSTLSSETVLENRKLQYWYVSDEDKLVIHKDQACVLVDEELGVSFLVKIRYQDLLQSGNQYKLDFTRPLGENYVFAYLLDGDCCDVAQPPAHCMDISESTHSLGLQTSRAEAVDKPKIIDAQSVVTVKRTVHEISDSDSDTETSSPSIALCTRTSTTVKGSTSQTGSLLHTLQSEHTAVQREHSVLNMKRQVGTLSSEASSAGRQEIGSKRSFEDISESNSQSSVDSLRSSAFEEVADFVLLPESFEIVLCVDNREFYGSQANSKSLLPDLIRNGVTCDLRLLSVGDLLWVAREKTVSMPAGLTAGLQPVRKELVLNYIVERKRMDDFVSSMIGGRLREQKFRLKQSGIQEKIILIESYGSWQHFSISEDRIKQAIANTEIIDGFTVKITRSPKETAAYLTIMTRYLQSHYQNKTLQSCSRDSIKQLGIQFHVRDMEQMLMPFDHFNQTSLKTKPLSVLELFAKQLIQLWGMSAEKAKAIVAKYPTPRSLFEAYASCTTEKERDSLLANIKYGKNLRNVGISLSRQIAQLYTSKVLT